MNVTIRIDSADSHVHVRMWVNGALAGALSFRPAEWFEFDAALEAAFGVRYVIENTTAVAGLVDAARDERIRRRSLSRDARAANSAAPIVEPPASAIPTPTPRLDRIVEGVVLSVEPPA